MEKETKFLSGEPQEYKLGKYTCVVEPRYRVDGEDINAILPLRYNYDKPEKPDISRA